MLAFHTLQDVAYAKFHPAVMSKDDQGYRHIVSYDTESLFAFGFMHPMGSVLTWGMCFRAAVMCGGATFVSQFRCQAISKDWSFCFPVISNADGLIFATLTAFLLGNFVTLTFSRSQTVRGYIGVLVNSILNCTMLLQMAHPALNNLEPEAKRILRWLHLAHHLTYKQARRDYEYQALIDKGLMTPAESSRLLDNPRCYQPALVYAWCIIPLQQLSKTMCSVSAMSQSLACVTNSFNASNDLSAILNTQLSYPYVQLITIITKVHLVLLMIFGGGVISEGITMHEWNRILLGYFIIILNMIIYEGLLQIHDKLHNPLGRDDADFPSHLYAKSALAICDTYSEIPPPE